MKIDADKAIQYVEMIDTLEMILAPSLHAKIVEQVRSIILTLCNTESFVIDPEVIDEMALVETLVYKVIDESHLFGLRPGFTKREFLSLCGLSENDLKSTDDWLNALALPEDLFKFKGTLGEFPIFYDIVALEDHKTHRNGNRASITNFNEHLMSSKDLYEAMLEDQVEDLIIDGLESFDITTILDKYSSDLHGMGFAMKEIQRRLDEMASEISGDLSKIGRIPGYKPLLHPKVVVYASALYQVMYLHNASGDSEKVIEIGEQLLQMGPEDPYEIKGCIVAHGLVTNRNDLVDELMPHLSLGSIEYFYNRALVAAVRKEPNAVLLMEEAIEAYPLVAELMLYPERTDAVIDKITFGNNQDDRTIEAVFHYHTSSLTAWEQFPTIMSQLGHLYKRRKSTAVKDNKAFAKVVHLDSKRK